MHFLSQGLLGIWMVLSSIDSFCHPGNLSFHPCPKVDLKSVLDFKFSEVDKDKKSFGYAGTGPAFLYIHLNVPTPIW